VHRTAVIEQLEVDATGSVTMSPRLGVIHLADAPSARIGSMVKGPAVFTFARTSELWFWSDGWQEIETEADKEIASGSASRIVDFAQLREHLDRLKNTREAC